MALITDPDSLSQGATTNVTDADFGAPSGEVVTVTSTANLPSITAADFLEVRDHSVAAFNGLYQETGGSPTTSSITMTKISGGSIASESNPASEEVNILGTSGDVKSVMFDTAGKHIYLLEKGNLSTDGVTMLALHSFAKEEWKADAFLIAAAPFPIVGISFAAGQWQIGVDPSGNYNGWDFADNIASPTAVETRRLIRDAGWDEIDDQGNTVKKYFNVTTLPTTGAFEDSATDQAHYRFGTDATDTAAGVDFEFAGEVNEPVLYFDEVTGPDATTGFDITGTNTIERNDGGNWATDGYQVGGQVTVRAATTSANDGTWTITSVQDSVDGNLVVSGTLTNDTADQTMIAAVDNSNAFTAFLRVRDADPKGKTFAQANLAAGGETSITSKIIKLGLANGADQKIDETDANVAANSPYTEIRLRYLSAAYNREVDSATPRNYGIIVDVGTYSRDNGASATSVTFTSANHTLGAGEQLTDYNEGVLIIHEGTDQGSHDINGTPTDAAGTLTITLDSALTASESNLSFTMERSSPVTATSQEIYEKVQYQLRQNSDIDETSNTVVGNTADNLLTFVGDKLYFGSVSAPPTNPNGGGTGVICEGFDTNYTNDMIFIDSGDTERTFPFVAAGNMNFPQLAVDDTAGEYWMFFQYTDRTTNSDIDTVTPSGSGYNLTGTLPNMAVGDYIYISGFAQAANNGLFIVDVETTPSSDYDVSRVDGEDVGTAETNQTVNIDENPYPSPHAIIVNNNAGSPIEGTISSTQIGFDFDYDNNVQGGRTASTDAAVVLVAGGEESIQMARTADGSNDITESTGLSITLTPPQERNYDNP